MTADHVITASPAEEARFEKFERVAADAGQRPPAPAAPHRPPAPPPPPAPPAANPPLREEVASAPHLIFSVRESLRLSGTFLALGLLACFWVPWPAEGGSKMAWQVMSDDKLTPGFAEKFLVGYALIAGLAALFVTWLAKAGSRGLLVAAACAPVWAVPLVKQPVLLQSITGGPGWVRLAVQAAFAGALAVAYARAFFHWSWTARVLLFLLGPAIVALYFVAAPTGLLQAVLDAAKKDSRAWLQIVPLAVGFLSFFAVFLGNGGKWLTALLVTAGVAFYLFDPARQAWSAYHAGGKRLVAVFDAARTPLTLGSCALLTVLGLGDWLACLLLRLHLLRLQERRAG